MKKKHKKFQFILTIIAGLLVLAACSPSTKTLYVGAEQVDCVGSAPQKCLLIKENPNDDYTYFYSHIEGFEWEAGYEYELRVKVTENDNPPADASSLHYQLVEVVSKTPVQ